MEQLSEKDRRGRRLILSCRVAFFAEAGFEGDATLLDVSTSGSRLSSPVAVHKGMVLRLSIFLADHHWPLLVDQAMVRWVHGQEFGVEFLTLRLAQRERLRALITNSPRHSQAEASIGVAL